MWWKGSGRRSLDLSRLNLTKLDVSFTHFTAAFHGDHTLHGLCPPSIVPVCAPSQEQDVLQDDLWRVQASDLVWVRCTRCVGTQRNPRGESVPHVEDRSGLSQASRGGDLDTYRSAGCSRFKSGSGVRRFITEVTEVFGEVTSVVP